MSSQLIVKLVESILLEESELEVIPSYLLNFSFQYMAIDNNRRTYLDSILAETPSSGTFLIVTDRYSLEEMPSVGERADQQMSELNKDNVKVDAYFEN
ncbi:Protein of unknown function [Gryllus bimaculatus]|nr:Protein of unknown function [Gryllus bimaculatus]